MVGGPGLVSGLNLGTRYAVFETGTRNTGIPPLKAYFYCLLFVCLGTGLAGKDTANPTAFIRASVDLLNYLGHFEHANLISDALYKTLTVDKIHVSFASPLS